MATGGSPREGGRGVLKASGLWRRTNWERKDRVLLGPLEEWDVSAAGPRVLRAGGLVPERFLRRLDREEDKLRRAKMIGVLLREHPELVRPFEEGFAEMRREFFEAHALAAEEVCWVARDSVGVAGRPLRKLDLSFPWRRTGRWGARLLGPDRTVVLAGGPSAPRARGLGADPYPSDGFLPVLETLCRAALSSSPAEFLRAWRAVRARYAAGDCDPGAYAELRRGGLWRSPGGALMDTPPWPAELAQGAVSIEYNWAEWAVPLLGTVLEPR